MMIQAISGYKGNSYTSKRVKNDPQPTDVNFKGKEALARAEYNRYFNAISQDIMQTGKDAATKFDQLWKTLTHVRYPDNYALLPSSETNRKANDLARKFCLCLHDENLPFIEKVKQFAAKCREVGIQDSIFPFIVDKNNQKPLVDAYKSHICFLEPGVDESNAKTIIFGVNDSNKLWTATEKGVTTFHENGNVKRIKYNDDLDGANYYKKNGDIDWVRSIYSIIVKE